MYHASGQNFEEVVTRYMMHHYMYSGPDCFLLAKQMDNYWFVECAVGENSLARFLAIMPYDLPQLAWARGIRNGPLKFYDTNRVKSKIL